MILFIIGSIICVYSSIKNEKIVNFCFCCGIIVVCISFMLGIFAKDADYNDYSVKQLEEKAIHKSKTKIYNLELKLVETEEGNKYIGTYFEDRLTEVIVNEAEKYVKMIKSDEKYSYLEIFEIKEETSIASYIFSMSDVVWKWIDAPKRIYVFHCI